jgi:hypothetical protein
MAWRPSKVFHGDLMTTSSISKEKRDRTRIQVDAKVVLYAENKSFFLDGVTRDISMKGLFARSDFGFPVGTKCQIEIILMGRSSELTIKLSGIIVRREKGGCGVLFEDDLEWWPVFAMHLANSERSGRDWKFLEAGLLDLHED